MYLKEQVPMATPCTNFYKVVILQQESGSDPDTIKFRQLLMRLFNGLSIETDWKTLLEHSPTTATNTAV